MGDVIPLKPSPIPEGELVCVKCQTRAPAATNFCPKCGNDLRGRSGTSDTFRGFLPGKVIDDRYRLLERLGEGGMGTVFKVEHVRMGKVMALKVLRPDAALDATVLDRFRTEARIVSKLSDPNTISVFDFGELGGGSLYIAMEYVQGRDLAAVVEAEGRMPERRAAQIGVQVLRSLAEAHEAGIVHRDIKPANVMVVHTRQGEDWVKVVDFGIAKLQEGAKSGKQKRVTAVSEFLGTPLYCSPEQARGEELDARSDLYSVGAMLFELVTGDGPYDGPTPLSIVTKHVMDPVPHARERLPELSERLDALLVRAMAKNPAERFQSADAMRAALEELAGPVRRTSGEVKPPDTGGIPIASREDWDAFEKSLARGSHLRLYLGALLILGLFAVAGLTAYRHLTAPVEALPMLVEEEINDDPQHANLIALDTRVQGAIGAPHKAGRSDEDTFVFEVEHPGTLWVSLTGVPDLNLVLELFDAERQTRHEETPFTHVSVDDGRLGEGELLGPYPVHAGKYFLRVSERPAYDEPDPNRPPRERGSAPYFLTAHVAAATELDEREPNDIPGAAQPLTYAQPVLGYAGLPLPQHALERELALSSLDFYSAPTIAGSSSVAFLVQPSDRALGMLDAVTLQRWQTDSKAALARRDDLEKRARLAPADRDLAKELRRWASPFLAAPSRANVDGVAALRLEAQGSHVAVLVEPLSGGAPTPADAPYGLAFAHLGPDGLEAVLSLARELASAHRGEQAKALLKAALAELPSAADAEKAHAQLTALP